MSNKTLRCLSLILLILWMCLIFFFSSQSAQESDKASDGLIEIIVSRLYPGYISLQKEEKQVVIDHFSLPFRKAAHFAEFFILGAISLIYFVTFKFKQKKLYIISPFVLGALYAVSDEVHQLFVQGRACRIIDVFIDSAGVLLAVLFLYLILLRGDKIG